MNDFKENLKVGTDFELNVAYDALCDHFNKFYVWNNQSHVLNKHGPAQRARRGRNIGNCIVPDFMLFRDKDIFFVEAKYKSFAMKAHETATPMAEFITLDHKKYNEYKLTVTQIPNALLLCFGIQRKGFVDIYLTDWNDEPELYSHSGNLCPVYYIHDMVKIGTHKE